MNHPCQSLATLTVCTAVWVSPLRPWGAAKGATTTVPSPWSTASFLLKTNSMTSAQTAPMAFLSHRGHFRHYPDTSPSSPVWSIPILVFLLWARAAGLESTPLWGSPWGQPMVPVRTSPQAAVEDTQTFLPVLSPGWMKWTMGSFDWTISFYFVFCVFYWIWGTGRWLCKGLDLCLWMSPIFDSQIH